jgi:hypothetical protein
MQALSAGRTVRAIWGQGPCHVMVVPPRPCRGCPRRSAGRTKARVGAEEWINREPEFWHALVDERAAANFLGLLCAYRRHSLRVLKPTDCDPTLTSRGHLTIGGFEPERDKHHYHRHQVVTAPLHGGYGGLRFVQRKAAGVWFLQHVRLTGTGCIATVIIHLYFENHG